MSSHEQNTPSSVLVQALERAIRAEESGKSAHHRLDRMNGSIDRLGNEVSTLGDELGSEVRTLHEALSSAREHVDEVVGDVKLDVAKQGVRVGLIAAGASAAVTAALGVIAALLIAHFT